MLNNDLGKVVLMHHFSNTPDLNLFITLTWSKIYNGDKYIFDNKNKSNRPIGITATLKAMIKNKEQNLKN